AEPEGVRYILILDYCYEGGRIDEQFYEMKVESFCELKSTGPVTAQNVVWVASGVNFEVFDYLGDII
ncbi:MAG: hypothetical protein EZS28_040345, partial [Streblomastix strix]